MVKLKIASFDIPTGSTLVAMNWQVSSTMLFRAEDIVAESLGDAVNLNTMRFDVILDPSRKWYGRAQPILSTGAQKWSNIVMVTPEEINDIDLDADMPSPITIPVITTDSNPDNHINTLFTINIANFNVIGTAKHLATTYTIEDINGNIYWYRTYVTTNKTSITVSDVILPPNRIFRIKCYTHSTSNDASPLPTLTIRTGNNTNVNFLVNINTQDITLDNVLRIAYTPGVINTTWSLYGVSNDISYNLWSDYRDNTNIDTDIFTTVLPANILKRGGRYILAIQTNLDEVPYFNVFGIGTLLRPIIDPDNTVDENSACCNGLDQAALYISSDPNNTIVLGMDGGIYNPTPEELAGNFVTFEQSEF